MVSRYTVLFYRLLFLWSRMDNIKFRTKVLENTARIFKKVRGEHCLSQIELAKILYLDLESIKAIENEQIEISSVSWHLFCQIFKIDRDSIFVML